MTWAKIKTKHKQLPEKDLSNRRELLEKAQGGSTQAFEAYRKLNEGLFEKIVGQYARYVAPDDLDDLRQEGLLGLLKGIKAYDPKKAEKTKPEGYIFSWVRASVANFARTRGHISQAGRIDEMTVNEEGEECSIFERLHAFESETPTPEGHYADAELAAFVWRVTSRLRPKERVIAERRTLSETPETLENIGAHLGVSRERIRQMELELKAKLRRRMLEFGEGVPA